MDAPEPRFIDPRESPRPKQHLSFARSTSDHAEVAELIRLCREGRIYAVEKWIKSGWPLYATSKVMRGRRPESALKVAVGSRQHDLALLLLSNGFPPDSPDEKLLSYALNEKAWSFVDLLLDWGADPLAVEPYDVLDTYDSALYDRFAGLGVDLTEGHALAFELARRSSNRPAYGWARRHRDDPRVARELAIALCDAVDEDRERAVALLLWAGADPHARVPNLRWYRPGEEEDPDCDDSAVAVAIRSGNGKYLAKLKPDPGRDDLELLWRSVHDADTVDYLVKVAPPSDWSQPLISTVHRLAWGFRDSWRVRQCAEQMISKHCARLVAADGETIANLRRAMLKATSESDMLSVLRWMSRPEHCDPAIYREIMRTASMQRRFGGHGLRKPTGT